MPNIVVLQCTACGAPAADSIAICPYCYKATGLASLGHTHGIEIGESSSMTISEGAHLHIGSRDQGCRCPFCGADAKAGAAICEYCQAKLVIKKLRIAQLVIDGGSMTISGGSVEIVGKRERAIHRAAAANDLAGVKQEIQDGDDPNFEDERSQTPLHHAAKCAAFETVQWLLAIGASPNRRDATGATPLALARKADADRVVELLAMYTD